MESLNAESSFQIPELTANILSFPKPMHIVLYTMQTRFEGLYSEEQEFLVKDMFSKKMRRARQL